MFWRLFKRTTAVEPVGEQWGVYTARNYEHLYRKLRKFGLATALDFLTCPVLLRRSGRICELDIVPGDK